MVAYLAQDAVRPGLATCRRAICSNRCSDRGRGRASSACLPPNLPEPPAAGRLIILAAGKAAGVDDRGGRTALSRAMPAASPRTGSPVWRSRATATAGRPAYCDGRGRPSGARCSWARRHRTSACARRSAPVPTISCWCCSPAALRPTGSRRRTGLTLAEKQAVTRALLRSGANIGEINTVRKHLSRIKGGRLAAARPPGAAGRRWRFPTCLATIPR